MVGQFSVEKRGQFAWNIQLYSFAKNKNIARSDKTQIKISEMSNSGAYSTLGGTIEFLNPGKVIIMVKFNPRISKAETE